MTNEQAQHSPERAPYLHYDNRYYTAYNEKQEHHYAFISSHLKYIDIFRFWGQAKKGEINVHMRLQTCLPISFTSWDAFLIENWIVSKWLTTRPIWSVCKISGSFKTALQRLTGKPRRMLCITCPFKLAAVWVPTSSVCSTTWNEQQNKNVTIDIVTKAKQNILLSVTYLFWALNGLICLIHSFHSSINKLLVWHSYT